MKHLLLTALACLSLIAVATPTAQAGGSSSSSTRVHSSCGQCRQPVFAYSRPVRYISNRAVYGWVPEYHNRCGRTPAQVFNYGFGGRVTRHYTYPDVRSYNVYRTYPTSRTVSGFRVPAHR